MTSPRVPLSDRVIAVCGLLLLAAVAIARQGEVVARGNLLPYFESYEVARVRMLGAEFYVDTSVGAGDLLTAGAFVLVAVVLLLAARVASESDARCFASAAWACSFLAGDDLLSAHETLGHNLPFLARLPIVDHPDDAIIALYALVAAAFAWRHRDVLLRVPRRALMIAVVAGVLAVMHDLLPFHYGRVEEALEVIAAGAALFGVLALVRPATPRTRLIESMMARLSRQAA